ncbi:hypothetical protein C4J81_00730 [Deltaproteobacteria bacterium Smac51]|nr:hypothetical protein C4J81_00730 [Deltaproteobacteria bacterium Smac51]
MKLTCPRCFSKSTVPDERVPAGGAWAKCPKCKERFFINPGAAIFQTAPDVTILPSRPAGRSEEAQSLLARMRKHDTEASTRIDGPPYDPSMVTLFPEPLVNYRVYFLTLGLLVAGLAAFLINVFRDSAGNVPPGQSFPAQLAVNEYNEDDFINELRRVRRTTHRRNHLLLTIDHKGLETRVFQKILDKLVPGACPEVVKLMFVSDHPAGGFNAEITCRPDMPPDFEMEVRWRSGSALINLPGRNQRMTVPLFMASRGDEAVKSNSLLAVNEASFEGEGAVVHSDSALQQDDSPLTFESYEDYLESRKKGGD